MDSPAEFKHIFSVSTKGSCVLCLEDNKTVQECSFQNISSHLKLDFRKIFNITRSGFLDKTDTEDADVEIVVPLCKACDKLRSNFYEVYEQFQQQLSSSLQAIQHVMVNAERNVTRVGRYKENIGAGESGAVQKTIAERFREEAILKCSAYQAKTALSRISRPNKLNDSQRTDSNAAGGTMKNENFCLNENEAEDEEDDPEALMIKYNSRNEEPIIDEVEETYDMEAEGMIVTPENESDNKTIEEEDYGASQQVEVPSSSTKTTDKKPFKPTFFNRKYDCDICGKTVVGLKNLELHKRRHAGMKPFECQHCKQTFRDTSNLRSHVLRNHQNVLFAKFKDRSIVPSDFRASVEKLVRSVAQTVPVAPGSTCQTQKCGFCNKEYSQKSVMEDHVIQRHYDVLATCIRTKTIQEKVTLFPSEEVFAFMEEVHKGRNTSSVCGVCGEDFGTGSHLNNHIKEHLKVTVTREMVPPQVKMLPARSSSNLINMKMKCSTCGKYFDNLSSLNQHNELFQGKCGSDELRQVTYKCKFCFRNFCSYYSQRSHLMSIHRYAVLAKHLPVGTSVQQMTFGVNEILKNNKKLPSGLFQCSMCHKQITQMRKLHAHILVSHFDDVVTRLREILGGSQSRVRRVPSDSTSFPTFQAIGKNYTDTKGDIDEDYIGDDFDTNEDEEMMGDPSSMLQIVFDDDQVDESNGGQS